MSSIASDLLGGAERMRPRVHGFADWSPHTLALLELVRQRNRTASRSASL
jgi:hypothetical protein